MTEDLIYASHALTYLERGYSPIPLPPAAKWPPAEGYTGKAGKTADQDEVRDWCVDRPDANIALRLPEGVVSLDVDATRGGKGAETMRAALEQFGPLPLLGRSTASLETRGHGHYLFRVPRGTILVESLNHLIGPNVDIIQHHHRYLVAPPSVHPDGSTYQWVPSPKHADLVSFPPVDRLPALPESWLEALKVIEREDDAEGVAGGDRAQYETFSAEIQAQVDFHTQAEIDRTFAKLEGLKSLGEGERDEDGRGWHEGIRDHTKYLARLCNASWSPAMPQDLMTGLREHLPHDASKTLAEGLNMFVSAVEQPDGSDLPTDISAALLIEGLGGIADPTEPAAEPEAAGDEPPSVTNPYTGEEWPDLEQVYGHRFTVAADVLSDMADALVGRVQRNRGVWMVWNGQRWEHDHTGEVTSRIVVSLLGAQNPRSEPAPTKSDPTATKHTPYTKSWVALYDQLPSYVVAKLTAQSKLTSDTDFDQDQTKINTPGGLLDLETGEVAPHDPSMMVTGITQASYRPNARHPDLDRVLSIHPDEVVEHLQLVIGAGITGHADHRLTLCHGPGGNGKTTLLGSILAALGTYGFAGRGQDLADIMAGKGHKMVAAFEGRRLVLFEELAREGHLDAATIKRLVGGGKQGGDRKYEAYREWDPTATVVINANSMPRISESDAAIYRRLRAIPLTGVVPEENQDPNIERRLRTERSALEAVFAWAVEGAQRFIAAGCVLPTPKSAGESVAKSTRVWIDEFDTTGQFIESALVPTENDDDWIPLKEIYERFEKFWAEERGIHVKPFAPQRFYGELRDRGVNIYEPGGSQKAKRKLTQGLLAQLHTSAAQVLEIGETVTPVRGWAFRDQAEQGTSIHAMLEAIERRES